MHTEQNIYSSYIIQSHPMVIKRCCLFLQDGTAGSIGVLAKEYSRFYGTSLSDVCERMEELRKRKLVQEADKVGTQHPVSVHPAPCVCTPSTLYLYTSTLYLYTQHPTNCPCTGRQPAHPLDPPCSWCGYWLVVTGYCF